MPEARPGREASSRFHLLGGRRRACYHVFDLGTRKYTFCHFLHGLWEGEVALPNAKARKVKEIGCSHPLRFADRGSLGARATIALATRSHRNLLWDDSDTFE
jgi:hypothetical protein